MFEETRKQAQPNFFYLRGRGQDSSLIEVCVGLVNEPGRFLNFFQKLSLDFFKAAFLKARRWCVIDQLLALRAFVKNNFPWFSQGGGKTANKKKKGKHWLHQGAVCVSCVVVVPSILDAPLRPYWKAIVSLSREYHTSKYCRTALVNKLSVYKLKNYEVLGTLLDFREYCCCFAVFASTAAVVDKTRLGSRRGQGTAEPCLIAIKQLGVLLKMKASNTVVKKGGGKTK